MNNIFSTDDDKGRRAFVEFLDKRGKQYKIEFTDNNSYNNKIDCFYTGSTQNTAVFEIKVRDKKYYSYDGTLMELDKLNSMVQFKDSYDKLFYICFYDEIGIVRIFDITNYFPTNIIKLECNKTTSDNSHIKVLKDVFILPSEMGKEFHY